MEHLSRLLALETTGVAGGVALCEGGEILECASLDPEQRSARSLAPAIRDILHKRSWSASDIDVVAVAIGPGSFTGLRVGIATAKMFAWSVGAFLVGVDSLDAIAYELDAAFILGRLPGDARGALISVGLDAQRGDVASRDYWLSRESDGSSKLYSVERRFRVLSNKKWLGEEYPLVDAAAGEGPKSAESTFPTVSPEMRDYIAQDGRRNTFFVGEALDRVKNRETLYPNAQVLVPDNWGASPFGVAGVAGVALTRVERGLFDNPFTVAPIYSRKAAAEERAIEKARAKAAEGK